MHIPKPCFTLLSMQLPIHVALECGAGGRHSLADLNTWGTLTGKTQLLS